MKSIDPSAAEDVDLYAAMKYVLSGSPCVTPLQKACKGWLGDKTSAFMDRFSALEVAKVGADRAKSAIDAPDVGTENAMRVLEEWLRAHGEQKP